MDTDAESSFVVNRIAMEDNIFDKNSRRDYRATSDSHVRFSPIEPPKESRFSQISSIIVLTFVVVQVVLGLFANSLALISDACRQFSDHLEQHKYDHSGSPGSRMKEVIMMAVPCTITAILCVVFLVNASTRAANPVFEISIIYLIIGTAIALAMNFVQVLVHLHNWKTTRSYSAAQFAKNHRSQCLHGFINHGLALTIVVVTILLIISDSYRISDSIGTYLIIILIITNIAAASRQCYKEYCDLEFVRADYEEL